MLMSVCDFSIHFNGSTHSSYIIWNLKNSWKPGDKIKADFRRQRQEISCLFPKPRSSSPCNLKSGHAKLASWAHLHQVVYMTCAVPWDINCAPIKLQRNGIF